MRAAPLALAQAGGGFRRCTPGDAKAVVAPLFIPSCLRSCPKGQRSQRTSDSKTLAALGTTGVDDCAATASLHAHQKTMGAGAANLGRLVSTFHGESSVGSVGDEGARAGPPAGPPARQVNHCGPHPPMTDMGRRSQAHSENRELSQTFHGTASQGQTKHVLGEGVHGIFPYQCGMWISL